MHITGYTTQGRRDQTPRKKPTLPLSSHHRQSSSPNPKLNFAKTKKPSHDVAWRRSTTTTATLSCVLNRIARLTIAFASSSAPIPGSFLSSCLMNVAHCCEFTVSQSPSDASTCTQTRHDVSRLIAVKPSNCHKKNVPATRRCRPRVESRAHPASAPRADLSTSPSSPRVPR